MKKALVRCWSHHKYRQTDTHTHTHTHTHSGYGNAIFQPIFWVLWPSSQNHHQVPDIVASHWFLHKIHIKDPLEFGFFCKPSCIHQEPDSDFYAYIWILSPLDCICIRSNLYRKHLVHSAVLASVLSWLAMPSAAAQWERRPGSLFLCCRYSGCLDLDLPSVGKTVGVSCYL